MNIYLGHRRKAFGKIVDPLWSSVVFLQNFQGANGSKPSTDQSQYAHALTWNTSAIVSTTRSPFSGGSSLALDGISASIQAPDSNAFYLPGDFTIELWLYPTANPGSSVPPTLLLGQADFLDYEGEPDGYYPPVMPLLTDGYLGIRASSGIGNFIVNTTATSAPQLSLNTWVYTAFTRSGNSWRCWIGTSGATTQYLIGTGTYTGTPFDTTIPLSLGRGFGLYGPYADHPNFQGYIGPVRITKGVARDVSAVPTAPFPTGA